MELSKNRLILINGSSRKQNSCCLLLDWGNVLFSKLQNGLALVLTENCRRRSKMSNIAHVLNHHGDHHATSWTVQNSLSVKRFSQKDLLCLLDTSNNSRLDISREAVLLNYHHMNVVSQKLWAVATVVSIEDAEEATSWPSGLSYGARKMFFVRAISWTGPVSKLILSWLRWE